MHMDPLLPTIIAALAGVLLVGILMRAVKQPHVIAYLIGGVLLGPHVLGLFDDEATLARLGDVGVVLLLFFVGMEVSFPHLARGWRVAVGGTALQITASVASAFALGMWLDWPMPRILLIGFAISLSSTAVVVSLLQGKRELNSPRGRDALGILIAQDMAIVPMLVILSTFAGETPSMLTLGKQVFGAVLLGALLTAIARRDRLSLPFGKWLRDDHELQVFAAFLLCFGFAWVTATLGLSTALGAFVAGVVVAAANETDWVHRSLEPFRVLLVALFFVSVGLLIDLDFLLEHWLMVSILVVATMVLNTLINAGILKLLGRRWPTAWSIGALLAPVGEFSFVLAAVGRAGGIISEYAYQGILGVIGCTLLLSPLWNSLVHHLGGTELGGVAPGGDSAAPAEVTGTH
ncbi:MAG: sodium/hydrogen exchanger [Planctomycetota bacterium]|nr:MAG: sodium/hydrogen exchanger [Planctomycetota bacterium]